MRIFEQSRRLARIGLRANALNGSSGNAISESRRDEAEKHTMGAFDTKLANLEAYEGRQSLIAREGAGSLEQLQGAVGPDLQIPF